MAAESVLECRDLRWRFGEIVAVDGVGFHIDPGETLRAPRAERGG